MLAQVTSELGDERDSLGGRRRAPRGGIIHVSGQFTNDDLTHARAHNDPVLAEAITAADGAGDPGQITQYLASVHDLRPSPDDHQRIVSAIGEYRSTKPTRHGRRR
jgi:hypothetical protein